MHLFIFAKMRFLKKRGKARKTKKTGENRRFSVLHLFRPEHLEAPPGIGPGMKVLQTSALPLGYGAGWGKVTGGCGALNPRVERRIDCLCSVGTTRLEYRRLRRYSGFGPRTVRKRAGRITGSFPLFFGADYGARTRHLDLGKVALYQMS